VGKKGDYKNVCARWGVPRSATEPFSFIKVGKGLENGGWEGTFNTKHRPSKENLAFDAKENRNEGSDNQRAAR